MKYSLIILFCFAIIYSVTVNATYISDLQGRLWQYNERTNDSLYIGHTGVMFDIALDPKTQILYGVNGFGSLYEINTDNGSKTYIGRTNAFVNGLTFNEAGILYGSGHNSIYTVNLENASTQLIGSGHYRSSGDIAFDPLGNLYLSSAGSFNDSLWKINSNTGQGTLLGQIGFRHVYGLNYRDNTLYGYSLSGQTLTLNTITGSGQLLSHNSLNSYGADGAGSLLSVAEPASLPLILMGLMATILIGRKKKNSP